MPSVVLRTATGETQLRGVDGENLMRMIQKTGQPNFGECEGCLACATCHVVVDPAWASLLPPVSDDEEAMLDAAFNLTPTSRLSCQITLSAKLDGMTVTIP